MARPKKSNRADGRYEIKRTIGYTVSGDPIKKSFYGSNKDEALRRYQEYLTEAERKEEARKRTDFVSWVEEWLYTYKEGSMKDASFASSYKRPCYNVIIPYFQGRILQEIGRAHV